MKKKFLLAAAALSMLASCSQNDDLSAPVVAENTQPQAIEFGTYVGKTPATRVTGGANGPITSAQVLAQKSGFGVFGYYTVDKDYLGTVKSGKDPDAALTGATDLTDNQAAATNPNFMYNQHVTGTDASTPEWSYTPLKYWPNGNTTADDQDNDAGSDPAKGTDGGKVSFFAYAPYWDKSTADNGIIDMSANDYAGNPTVTYKLASDGTAVDLLWGTAGTTNGVKAQDGTTATNDPCYIAKTPTTPAWSTNPYKVNANLTKMKTDGEIQFDFKHALAKVGGSKVGDGVENGLMIVADLDNNGAESGANFETGTVGGSEGTKLTKITVSSIVISNDINDDGNFDATDIAVATANKGTLDLATGQWTLSADAADKTALNHTIDATGSGTHAKLATAIAETTAPISSTKDDFFKCTNTWAGQTGVPALHPINVYNTETNPFVFIPGTTPVLRFKITYIVRTYDANLENGFSEITQTVSKKVTFSEAVKLNKMYNILIHLGMTSVKFDATVSDWDVTNTDSNSDGAADADPDKQVYLPINVSN